MTRQELEDLAIGFDELGFQPATLVDNPEAVIKNYQNMFKELLEDLDEKDILFAKLYLATEENKTLLRENRKLERKIKMLENK